MIVTDNKQIGLIAKYFGDNKSIDINQVELLFNRVADIIEGSPKQDNTLPDSVEFIANLLILREVLHHLQIKHIEVI